MERHSLDRTGGRLMIVYAHPDDEVFATGGTIALAARQGIDVTLVVATGGEEGEIVNPEMRGVVALADLPAVRQEELACSQSTLGIRRVVRLGYRDSGMAGTPSSREAAAFSNQARDDVARRLVEVIREHRPHVICTEPEDGGYGHPDHIALHRATVLAFERAGDPTWYPDAGEPWNPLKLYYATWSQSMFRELQAGYAAHGLEFRFGTGMVILDEGKLPGRSDADISALVDMRSTIHTKIQAMRCYRTQIMADFFFFTAPDDVAIDVLGREYFVLGASRVPTAPPESDLFAGITL
jgi:LmbE family N-acetylglucosaminyl deacetylase